MVSGDDLDVLKKSGKYPCVVCHEGVGKSSIRWLQCKLRVHKKCNVIDELTNSRPKLRHGIDGGLMIQVDRNGTKLDVEATFCYLGDMLYSSGGCDSAIAARCHVAWRKFTKLLLVVINRHFSPKMRGKVCVACAPW